LSSASAAIGGRGCNAGTSARKPRSAAPRPGNAIPPRRTRRKAHEYSCATLSGDFRPARSHFHPSLLWAAAICLSIASSSQGSTPSACISDLTTQQGEQARGDGDATRARIFADAYGKDPEFYAFYRSMQAYEAALKPDNTRLVLPPDPRFFRFSRRPLGRAAREIGLG
jgi:hypothetical protein